MKQYSCIVKVGTDVKDFVKYRTVNDLIKFTLFLDKNFPAWRYYNVYDKATKEQIASFTKYKRPNRPKI